MTEPVSRIQIISPERLHAMIAREIKSGRGAKLADGLLRLLELQSRYLSQPDNQPDNPQPNHALRVATIMPSHRYLTEIDWTIQENPGDCLGMHGTHVLTGGLVQHSDGLWGIHT